MERKVLNDRGGVAPTITSHYSKDGLRNIMKTMRGEKRDGRDAIAIIEYEDTVRTDT